MKYLLAIPLFALIIYGNHSVANKELPTKPLINVDHREPFAHVEAEAIEEPAIIEEVQQPIIAEPAPQESVPEPIFDPIAYATARVEPKGKFEMFCFDKIIVKQYGSWNLTKDQLDEHMNFIETKYANYCGAWTIYDRFQKY